MLRFIGCKYFYQFQMLAIFMQGLIIPGRRDAELLGSFDYLCDNTSNKSGQTEKQGVVDIYAHYANYARPAPVMPICVVCVSLSILTIKKKKKPNQQ